MKRIFGSVVISLAALAAQAAPMSGVQGFQKYGTPGVVWGFPANNLHLQDNFFDANMTEAEFNRIVDEVVAVWRPIAAARGVTLRANKDWNDSTVNASATQSGNEWIINMYGGLARRPEVTADGFALVVCHELGHHFGGYSFTSGFSWAANEGQSDYFATQACARTLWGRNVQANQSLRQMGEVPVTVQRKCAQAWGNNMNAQAWCERTAVAGFSLANLLGALGGGTRPSFETPDTTTVPRTNHAHPKAQCRLDTYFAGALCTKMFDLNVIPGRSHPAGQASADAERDAAKYSCTEKEGFTIGVRPRCWFKPLVE